MATKNKKNRVICERCGKPIPAARLEIIPDTTTCVQCSEARPYSEADVLGAKIIEDKGFDVTDMENDNDYNFDDYN